MAGAVGSPTIAGRAEVAVCQVTWLRIALATKASWGSHVLKGNNLRQFK